jgi:hypothetical protein
MVRSIRWWALVFGFAAIPLLRTAAYSQVPCDFKGVSVGEKLTREQLMQRFGIKQFKLDPPRRDFMQLDQEVQKYGIIGAGGREDDKIGPYCRENSCNIPFGIFVGDDKIPVKVFVAQRDGVVYSIEVFFNSIFWNDVWDIIVNKYGPTWEIERTTTVVVDYETKKTGKLEQVIARHKFGGINTQTKDTCSIFATNIDNIFRHHDSLGTLHAIFAIKRESKDF